jgi:hypothetical protein
MPDVGPQQMVREGGKKSAMAPLIAVAAHLNIPLPRCLLQGCGGDSAEPTRVGYHCCSQPLLLNGEL